MLTKNRLLLKASIRCKCHAVHELMCVAPWTIVKKRKASAFPHPSTLQKIKTASAKALRGIPKQMTPVLDRIRTSSNAIQKIAPPPNTPRFATPQNSNLDIIDEVNANKFSLDESHDDLTNTSSQKRNSATQSSEEIVTNSTKHSSRSRRLKPYSLTASSLVSKRTSSTPTISMDFAMNMNQLDTIPAEDEIMTFAAADIPTFEPLETDKSDLEHRASPKRYRSRRHASNVSIADENEIVEGFEILDIYDQHEEDEEFYFGRMKNIRATMREEHIEEIKIELASIAIDVEMKEESHITDDDDDDIMKDIDTNIGTKEEEEDQRASLKKKVEQIQLTKEELEQEKKVLQLKKKTNKRIAFGADMALEIVQESITTQEERRKAAQHEFYINAIMKNNRSATAHQMTPTPITKIDTNIELKAPKATPLQTPIKARSIEDLDDMQLTDDDLDETPTSTKPAAAHLRSRSDNQMIVDIANQIALHAKQLTLKKTGSERARKVNPAKLKHRNKKKKIHPRPTLNPQSASEGRDSKARNKKEEAYSNYLSPNDVTPSFKPKKHHANYSSDDLDSFDIDANGAIEVSPSPPPEAYLDAMRPYNNYKQDKNSTTHDLSSGHSVFETFRSWLTPSMHISTDRRSKTNSDRANNLEKFLKKQGFTIRSERRFSDLITPIDDNDVNKPYTIQEGDEEEETTTAYDEDLEEEEKCEIIMGHAVFHTNVEDHNAAVDSTDWKDVSFDGAHDRNASTAL